MFFGALTFVSGSTAASAEMVTAFGSTCIGFNSSRPAATPSEALGDALSTAAGLRVGLGAAGDVPAQPLISTTARSAPIRANTAFTAEG